MADEKIILPVRSVNWPATLAAVNARGPRCDGCGGWTFRPYLLTLPKRIRRSCPDCLPGLTAFLKTSEIIR
jgi:hypothetical protein